MIYSASVQSTGFAKTPPMNDSLQRYHGFAVGLHWIIAILILGMLGVGKYMVSLEESEPLRFLLTQWHKTFGVTALVLIVFRMLWRLTHRPPMLPGDLKPWELRVAEITHILLYLLIILIPVSGWIMVSASPLDLPTVLFNWIHWPHLAPFDSLPNKADISGLFAEIHALAGSVMILLLVAHIGAALRHQFVLRDGVMNRMSPKTSDGIWTPGIVPLVGSILFIIVGLIVYGYSGGNSVPVGAGKSRVQFTFTLQNVATQGLFPESTVELLLDSDNPAANTLNATINTATVTAGDSQIDLALLGSDWFDVENHPQASFKSKQLVSVSENSFSASGTLQIKAIARDLTFPVQLTFEENKRVARGSFKVNRLDFELGNDSQPDEDTAGFQVVVEFEFEVQ